MNNTEKKLISANYNVCQLKRQLTHLEKKNKKNRNKNTHSANFCVLRCLKLFFFSARETRTPACVTECVVTRYSLPLMRLERMIRRGFSSMLRESCRSRCPRVVSTFYAVCRLLLTAPRHATATRPLHVRA